MNSNNPIHAILDALALQQQRGETSLIVRLEPDLIPDAMNSLRDYRKLFVPVIPGLADTEAIYASYEVMRQADATKTFYFAACRMSVAAGVSRRYRPDAGSPFL